MKWHSFQGDGNDQQSPGRLLGQPQQNGLTGHEPHEQIIAAKADLDAIDEKATRPLLMASADCRAGKILMEGQDDVSGVLPITEDSGPINELLARQVSHQAPTAAP